MTSVRQMARIMKLPKAKRAAAMAKIDWTTDPKTGRSNSSSQFKSLATEVSRLIRDSAHDLIAGRTDDVGRLIVAQLAHKHGIRLARQRRTGGAGTRTSHSDTTNQGEQS